MKEYQCCHVNVYLRTDEASSEYWTWPALSVAKAFSDYAHTALVFVLFIYVANI